MSCGMIYFVSFSSCNSFNYGRAYLTLQALLGQREARFLRYLLLKSANT